MIEQLYLLSVIEDAKKLEQEGFGLQRKLLVKQAGNERAERSDYKLDNKLQRVKSIINACKQESELHAERIAWREKIEKIFTAEVPYTINNTFECEAYLPELLHKITGESFKEVEAWSLPQDIYGLSRGHITGIPMDAQKYVGFFQKEGILFSLVHRELSELIVPPQHYSRRDILHRLSCSVRFNNEANPVLLLNDSDWYNIRVLLTCKTPEQRKAELESMWKYIDKKEREHSPLAELATELEELQNSLGRNR